MPIASKVHQALLGLIRAYKTTSAGMKRSLSAQLDIGGISESERPQPGYWSVPIIHLLLMLKNDGSSVQRHSS